MLERALTRADDEALIGAIEASLAYVQAETGQREAALQLCEVALTRPGLPLETAATIHSQRALLLMLTGRPVEALAEFEVAIGALRSPKALGRAHGNRGYLFLQRHELTLAEVDFKAAAELLAAEGLAAEAAMHQHNLGYVRLLGGDLVGALDAMDEARVVLAPLSPVSEATCDQDRAEVLVAAGLASEAREALRACARAYGSRGLRRQQAEAELTLARSLLEDSPLAARVAARAAAAHFAAADAEGMRVRAEAVVHAADVSAGRVDARLLSQADTLSAALEGQGLRWPAATTRLLGGRVALRRGSIEDARARIHAVRSAGGPLAVRLLGADVRAELAAAQGQRAAAFRHLRTGLEELHEWQSSFGSLDLQTNVAGHGVRLGRRGLDLAVASRRPATLFEWSERARMLASRVQPVRAPQNPEIVDGLAELRGDVAPHREAELRARIRELAWQHDGSREVMDPVPLAELQAALDEQSALVAYVVAADQVVALVVTDRGCAWRDLGPRADLDDLLAGLLPDLDMAASDLPDPIGPVVRGGLIARLERLAALLVEPLAGDLGDRAAVLTPSGVLAGLPWTLLPGLAGRPVTVAQSATSWLARRTTPLRTATAGFVAGPRVARAEDEVTAPANEWPDATVLTGKHARCEEVSALAARVDVLHVAAHGHHSAENPLFSGLQLADGLWFGYDIDQLEGVPDVVLLSACEVGRSTVRWGEELIGMATAWLHAGARCVIASPAAVADQAAYDALVAVHHGLAHGLTPAAALAAAVPPATVDRPPVPFLCFG